MKSYFQVALCLLLCFNSITAQSPQKPNVLFIFADDQTFESIGSLNNNEVITPNLDRLKSMGTTFQYAFNMGTWSPAVCVASRAMMNTGKSVWHAAAYEKSLPQGGTKYMPTRMKPYSIEHKVPKAYWSEYMREAGYDTYMTGKWHVKVDAQDVFDVAKHVRGGMPNQSKERYARTYIEGHPDTTWTPYDKSKGGFWEGGKHWSEIVGDDALEFIDMAKVKDDPFFMYVAFNAPHDPRQSPKKYVDMYPVEDITVPENFLPFYPYAEDLGVGSELRDEKLGPFPRTEYSVKVNRQEYYAIITHMDAQIGRILDALEASGKADNTYIIFTADHGLALGDHGFIGKQNLYDRSIRVPFFIAGPGIKKDKTNNEMIYLQDAMATALDIAGSDAVEDVDFNSVLPLCSGKQKKGESSIYGAYLGSQFMVRTERYKMIIYPNLDVVRLYDLKKDPHEMKDLAAQAKYRKTMDELLEEFLQLQQEMDDPFDVTEGYENFFSKL